VVGPLTTDLGCRNVRFIPGRFLFLFLFFLFCKEMGSKNSPKIMVTSL
jgi:hypothetical protein